MYLKIFFTLVLTSFSALSFADTYPAIVQFRVGSSALFPTANEACNNWASTNWAGSTGYASTGSMCQRTGESNTTSYSAVYSCPAGGTLSGSSCINATACPANYTRSTTTGICNPNPITCYDGSTVTPPATCPIPSCPHLVNGSIITLRAWDQEKLECANLEVKQCDSQMEIADAETGDCLPKPGATDCGNGIVVIAPVQCSSEPDHSQAITCDNGLIIYPPRTCSPIPLDPASCGPGKTAGFLNDVAVCVNEDGTTEPYAMQTPNTDAYNPQAYKAGVACNSNYSMPCDPALPPVPPDVNLPTTDTCGPGTFFTCADAHSKPIPPDLYPKAPTPTNTETTGTSTSTSTSTTNIDGSVTTTSTTNTSGSSTTTGSTTTNCPDCAKESTLKELVNRVGGLTKGTANGVTHVGEGSFDNDMVDDAVQTAKNEYQAKFNQVKSSLSSMVSLTSHGSGSLPVFDFGTIKGTHVFIDLNRFESQLSYVGLTIILAAAIISVMLFLG